MPRPISYRHAVFHGGSGGLVGWHVLTGDHIERKQVEAKMVTAHGNIVHFSFFCPGAGCVRLVGAPPRSPAREWEMLPTREGYWLIQLDLPAGTFCFRYRVDGKYYVDRCEVGSRDRRTGWFSIIEVPGLSGTGEEAASAVGARARPARRRSTEREQADG